MRPQEIEIPLKLKFDECMKYEGLGVEYCMMRTFE